MLKNVSTTLPQFEQTPSGLLVRAPAKIKLSLLIAGKRPDGFHEIDTIMAKVNLYDTLLIGPARTDGVELVCGGDYTVSADSDNLAYKAADAFYKTAGLAAAVKITLTKNIPVGSGLAGGSSDAAAALVGLNKLHNNMLSDDSIKSIGSSLGSDIVFFLSGPIGRCCGRGEKVSQIQQRIPFCALLILPDIMVSTREVYENYRHDKELYNFLRAKINDGERENLLDLMREMCANMLEYSCFELHGELSKLKKDVENLGIKPICLSGSGSTMFCLFGAADSDLAVNSQRSIESELGCKTILVNSNEW